MKLIILFFFYSICICKSFCQITTTVYWTEKTSLPINNTIYYNKEKKLTWADFKGLPNQPEPIAAITSSGFGYNASMQSSEGKGKIIVEIYCYFNKQASWVKKGRTTNYILNHEQHHFDVTYLNANAFFEKIKTISLDAKNMNITLEALYNHYKSKMHKMQEDYDIQTANGQLVNRQLEWDIFLKKIVKN